MFEIPTTLEALHEMIASYATTGAEASLIIQRIHRSNSVRLDHRKTEKMQNFYDVVLRRFIAVGDAIAESGDGGEKLGRFNQLDCLTNTLYAMTQDSPTIATAVWSRRLGVLQNAHAKKLRDSEFEQDDDEEFSAWPSSGTFLLLKALGHLFPMTDKRHPITTPCLLFLGQIVAQTPILSMYDAVMATLFASLLVEYTKEAKRFAPEASSLVASILRLFASSTNDRREGYVLPSVGAMAQEEPFVDFRKMVMSTVSNGTSPRLTIEKQRIGDETPLALLAANLALAEAMASIAPSSEVVFELSRSVLALKPTKTFPCKERLATVAAALAKSTDRTPLQRKAATGPKVLVTKAPRLENVERLSRDSGKKAEQAAADRTRREVKREHKALARELRLDNAMVEEQRRKDKDKRESVAKAKRNKAYAWMENEQATLNQQVAQGGGLLQGGGMGAARSKAKSGKLGIKKGGKFKS